MQTILGVLNNNTSLISFVSLCKIWNALVPPLVAKNTTPTRINEKGELTVLVHDNIWLTELNYMKDDLRDRLNDRDFPVKKLTFKYSPTYIKADKPKRDFYKIDEAQLYFIESITDGIEDSELASTLRNALTGYFKTHTIEEFKHGGK